MKKKLLTVALAATMVVSSVFSAFAENITGTAWWDAGNQKSSPIDLADGATVTFDIAIADDNDDKYAAFCVEVTDGTNYFTTTSAGDAWGAGDPVKDVDKANAERGGNYTVTMTRNGNNFVAKYVNKSTGSAMFADLKLTGNKDFAATTVYVMAQVGSLTVTEVKGQSTVDKPEETQNPAEKPTEKPEEKPAPPTGDATPVAVMAIVALGAAVAVVASRKKVTE